MSGRADASILHVAPALEGRGTGGAGKRTGVGGIGLAALVVALASVLALVTEDLPRFFWDLQQWYLLAPTVVVGVALQLAAWWGWSSIAWLIGRMQGSTAGLRGTLAATGKAYFPALIQVLALNVSHKDPTGVTTVAVIKVMAAALVAVAVVAALAHTQKLAWPRAALSGIGWLLIALLVTAGYMQQVRLFGFMSR